jgi:hypothetical protein
LQVAANQNEASRVSKLDITMLQLAFETYLPLLCSMSDHFFFQAQELYLGALIETIGVRRTRGVIHRGTCFDLQETNLFSKETRVPRHF